MEPQYNDTNRVQNPTSSNPAGSSNTPNNNNQELFTRHNDTVLCCSIDNNNRLAVSGGIDDTAFVWDLNTKHVIFECLGHKESVVSAAFSANSTYVATGDLNGYIQVRNTTTGLKVFDYEIDEINWILWHNTSEFVLLSGTTKGDFWMWNVNDPAALKTFPSYGAASTAARLLQDGMKIVVTYEDGFVRVFDLKTKQALFQSNHSENAEILCIDLNPAKALLAIGCIDSSVKLITIGNCKVVGTLSCKTPEETKGSNNLASNSGKSNDEQMGDEHDGGNNVSGQDGDEDDEMTQNDAEPVEVIDEYSTTNDKDNDDDLDQDYDDEEEEEGEDVDGDSSDSNSVESVLFSPCGTFLAASNNSGSIYIWDVASQFVRCQLHTGVGITRCAWSDDGNYITGCLDGTVRIYNNNLNQLQIIQAHQDQVLDLALKSNTLVTASEDKTCRVVRFG